VRQQGLSKIQLDWSSLSDPAIVVPEAQAWDCQSPADSDAGQWVAVTAVCNPRNHNCGYLQQYPHQQLAGGGFYVFKLPAPIPVAGTPGGPPLVSERKLMWGMPFDMRAFTINLERHPEQLPAAIKAQIEKFQQEARRQQARKK